MGQKTIAQQSLSPLGPGESTRTLKSVFLSVVALRQVEDGHDHASCSYIHTYSRKLSINVYFTHSSLSSKEPASLAHGNKPLCFRLDLGNKMLHNITQ